MGDVIQFKPRPPVVQDNHDAVMDIIYKLAEISIESNPDDFLKAVAEACFGEFCERQLRLNPAATAFDLWKHITHAAAGFLRETYG